MRGFDKVAILGSGAFGIALARLAASNAKKIVLWGRDKSVCEYINQHRHHPTRLSQVMFPPNVSADSDLKTVLSDAPVIILALPMAALATVLTRAEEFFISDALVVCTTKGIEEHTNALPCDVIARSVSSLVAERSCYLSGPSFAIELAMGMPTALTIASVDKKAGMRVQEWFSQENCRLYRSQDVIGVCVGGAFKNVIAIAAGACLGLGLGRNALAALITRGLAEVTRLAVRMGGKPNTLSGLSGVGDLILSCTDDMSRNHRLGTLLATGQSLNEALVAIGSVVEGAKTAKAVPFLMSKYHVDLPISLSVHRVLYQGLSVKTAISSLLERKLKEE